MDVHTSVAKFSDDGGNPTALAGGEHISDVFSVSYLVVPCRVLFLSRFLRLKNATEGRRAVKRKANAPKRPPPISTMPSLSAFKSSSERGRGRAALGDETSSKVTNTERSLATLRLRYCGPADGSFFLWSSVKHMNNGILESRCLLW